MITMPIATIGEIHRPHIDGQKIDQMEHDRSQEEEMERESEENMI